MCTACFSVGRFAARLGEAVEGMRSVVAASLAASACGAVAALIAVARAVSALVQVTSARF